MVDEPPQSICMSPECGLAFQRRRTHCPVCGAPAMTLRHSRVVGWIMAACGAMILAIMAGVCWFVVPPIVMGRDVNGVGFEGSAGDAVFVLGVFAVVTGAGLAALAAGIAQLRTGRRDMRVFRTFLALVSVLFAIGMLIRQGVIA